MSEDHQCERMESCLEPYALRCLPDLAHEYPTRHPKFRSFFQQDKDRILHSEAFRRLGYKTQVFVVHEGDFYRTRLTHSLEVAQVSRSLAVALGANEDLCEAVAYAHDLGHPPFGHRGEDTLNLLFEEALEKKAGVKKINGRKAFEQNFQSYRVVSELEKRYPDFPGLNLSVPALRALLRHETAFDHPAVSYPFELIEPKKTEEIMKLYFTSKNPSLEAQIVNISDQIAWVTHDLEDALRVRFLAAENLDELDNHLLKMAEERCGKGAKRGKDKILWGRLLIRNMIDILITDLVSEAQGRLSSFNCPEAVEGSGATVISFSPEIHKAVRSLSDFLFDRVYTHPIAERMSSKASLILERIFFALTKDIEEKDSHSLKLLPYSTQELLKETGDTVRRLQIVVDFMAGMTDRFASEFYRILFEPEERGITSLY
jgi:dGTPase